MMEKVYRILVIVLLAMLVASQAYTIYSNYLEINTPIYSLECLDTLEEAELVVSGLETVINETLTMYENDVYDNPQVESLYHQTFMANQYQLAMLQTIALQQETLLKIIIACP